MSKQRLTLVVVAAVLMYSHHVQAAVVEVEVTVTSVDPKARGITVTYETREGQKSIDLDVSRKAEITVNGEAGTLDALRPGQKAKVTFEKELQVVTKITATGTGTAPGREVCRLTLQLSEFGDGNLPIEKTSQAPTDDFEGTPFTFPRWPHTKVTKNRDGVFRMVHDFSDPDNLDALTFGQSTITFNRELGVASLATTSPSESSDVKKPSNMYAKKLRPPITVACDIIDYGGGQCSCLLMNPTLGMLSCALVSKEPTPVSQVDIVVGWTEAAEDGKQTVTRLAEAKDVTPDQPYEKEFRLPLANAKIDESFVLAVVKPTGDEPTTISRLEVRGRIAPMFGMELGQKQGVVFAKSVSHNGLGEKTGIGTGDVILAINGKKPESMHQAVDMLGNLPLGEEAIFTIQRGGKTHILRVMVE